MCALLDVCGGVGADVAVCVELIVVLVVVVWGIVVSVETIGLGGVKSICISSGVGVLARSSDTVIYIEECWVLKDAEEGGALDSEEQEDDVEEEDEVDVSVVAEIVDSGSEVSRCFWRFSSMLSLSVIAGWSTGSCGGGDSSISICI